MDLGRMYFGRMFFGRMYFGRMYFGRMYFGRMYFGRMYFGRITFCTNGFRRNVFRQNVFGQNHFLLQLYSGRMNLAITGAKSHLNPFCQNPAATESDSAKVHSVRPLLRPLSRPQDAVTPFNNTQLTDSSTNRPNVA
jgi:hypothetical protein